MLHRTNCSRSGRRYTTTLLLIGVCAAAGPLSAAGTQPAPCSDEFETLEGWQRGEGDLTLQVKEGRLIVEGHGRLSKTFRVDVDAYPLVAMRVVESAGVYNIGIRPRRGGKRVQLFRFDNPGIVEKPIPIKGRGVRTVVVDLMLGPHRRFVFDYVRFLPPPGRMGGEVPPEVRGLGVPGRADRERAWYLSGPRLDVAVWRANGCVAAGWDRRVGDRVFDYSADLYRVESVSDETPAREADDRVLRETMSGDGTSLHLVCTNPKLPGVEIHKRYSVRPEPNIVAKQVTFRADRDWRSVIHWVSVCNLTTAFRRGGLYNNTAVHPKRDALIPADQIRVPASQPIRQQIVLWQPAGDRTAAHYRLKVDEHMVGPRCGFIGVKDDTYFTPTGWTFKALVDRLWPAKTPSAEVHFTVLDGDFVAFHRQYLALPEYQATHRVVSPAWVTEVKAEGWNPIVNGPERLREVDALLDEGYLLRTWWWAFNQSDYETRGTWKIPQASSSPRQVVKESEQNIRAVLRKVHTSSPRYKLAPHVWYHSVRADSKVFREHPDWFIRTKEGKYPVDHGVLHRRFLTAEHVDWLLERTRAMVTEFDFDAFYIDGGGFGSTKIDWPTLRVEKPYSGSMRLHEGLSVAGKPAWFNAVSGYQGFFNAIGYFEGFVDAEDWRALSIKLFEAKLHQQPGTWALPLYLHDYNRQQYVSACLLLGLQPNATVGREKLPFLNMAYELRPMLLRDIGLRPCWWRTQTELEAYALGWPGASDSLLITLLNHADQPLTTEIGFDASLTGLDPKRTTYAYRMQTRLVTALWDNTLSEPEDRELYDSTGWAPIGLPTLGPVMTFAEPAAVRASLNVQAKATELLGVTQVPALIWSAKGHRKYFPQSRTRWGHVAGQLPSLTVQCKQRCEVAAFIDTTWDVQEVTVDGTPAHYRRGIPDFVIVPVPAGRHTVRIEAERLTTTVSGPPALSVPPTATSGAELSISFPRPAHEARHAYVNICRGNTPIYTSRQIALKAGSRVLTHRVAIPAAVLPGEYEARASLEGVPGYLSAPLTIQAPPIHMPDGWDEPEHCVREAEQIGRNVGGFRQLRRFRQWCGRNSSNEVREHDSHLLYVLMGDERVAGFAHDGVEYANVRKLSMILRLKGPADLQTFDAHSLAHVSFSVDFHTRAGYAKRVFFSVSKVNQNLAAQTRPYWGTASNEAAATVTTQYVAYRKRAFRRHRVWREHLDLAKYAPAGCDGRVIVGANVSMAAPRTLFYVVLTPKSRLQRAPAQVDDSSEQTWKNISFRPLEAVKRGGRAKATLDAGKMTFRASVAAPDAYAMAGMWCRNIFMPTLRVDATGTAFMLVDYLSPEACEKRVLLVLAGTEASARLAARLGKVAELAACKGKIQRVDLRREVAEKKAGYVLGLGKYAPTPWERVWQKACRFRVGAFGPNASVEVQLLDNEDFWRF